MVNVKKVADSNLKVQADTLRDMNEAELREVLSEFQAALMNERGAGLVNTGIGSASGDENTAAVEQLRRNIARVKTVLREKEGK